MWTWNRLSLVGCFEEEPGHELPELLLAGVVTHRPQAAENVVEARFAKYFRLKKTHLRFTFEGRPWSGNHFPWCHAAGKHPRA